MGLAAQSFWAAKIFVFGWEKRLFSSKVKIKVVPWIFFHNQHISEDTVQFYLSHKIFNFYNRPNSIQLWPQQVQKKRKKAKKKVQ